MSFASKHINKNPYELYTRYSKEMSESPYSEENRGKLKDFCSTYIFSWLPFLNANTEPIEKYVPAWAMSDEAVERVVTFMKGNRKLGFVGLSPSVLHDTWECHMMPHLFALWCKFLYGDEQNTIPDFMNFCLLVETQTRGKPQDKARVILKILQEKGYTLPRRVRSEEILIERETEAEMTVTKYDLIRYFYDLTASYLYGLGRGNNPEYLLWESCSAGLNENNLKKCMKYYIENISNKCSEKEIGFLLKIFPFLRTILRSSVSMMFGSSYTLNVVPFLQTPRETMLDVSLAVFLTSILKGEEDVNFEMHMIYSRVIDGTNFSVARDLISGQGPTFLIVKDEGGYVFGGYASAPWHFTRNFFGDDKCFLFRLLPSSIVCRASGTDGNYMYFSDPLWQNGAYGLGMGGDSRNFGLWISLTAEYGYCADSCPTWENYVRLSSRPSFRCVQLEVWRVGRRGQRTSEHVTRKVSSHEKAQFPSH